MKTLAANILAHLNDDPYLACHLIELQGSVVHRWTDWPVDVVYNGNTYSSSTPFTLSQIVSDAQGIQAVTISFDEEKKQIQGFDLTEGMKDRTVLLHEAWISPLDKVTVLDVQLLVKGRTEGLDFDESSNSSMAVLNVSQSVTVLNGSGPREKHLLDCINDYVTDGTGRCGYSGAISACDHTFADCLVHVNTPRFRGCRWALAPPKTVLWGGAAVDLKNRPQVIGTW